MKVIWAAAATALAILGLASTPSKSANCTVSGGSIVCRAVVDTIDLLEAGNYSGGKYDKISVTCYHAATLAPVCAGGGDFDRGTQTGSSCRAVADGAFIVQDGEPGSNTQCFVRQNAGLNGVLDARQCGLIGDGLPANSTTGHPDDASRLQVCLNLAGALGLHIITTGGGVVLDNTADIVIPSNAELTCGGTNASEARGDDYRIFDTSGNLQLTNAIVIDPRYKISIPNSSKEAALAGCTLEAGVGGSGISYSNTYSPSVWYPNCDPTGSGCGGSSTFLRSALYEQNAFYHNPGWDCSSGQDPNHPAGCSVGVAIAGDHATLRNVSILGFGTCYFVNNGDQSAVRPVIDHLAGDCDTGLSFLNSNGPKLNDFRIASLLTEGGESGRSFHICSIGTSGSNYTVQAEIVNPSDDSTFALATGDTVWIAPGDGAQSAAGRWTITVTGSGTCGSSPQTFTLNGSIATGITESHAKVSNVLADGRPPIEITGIDPVAINPDFAFVRVGQTVTDTASCIGSGTTVTAVWPARGIVYISKPASCASSSDTLTFADTSPTTYPACTGAPVPPDSAAGCALVDAEFRFADGVRIENVGGASAVNCLVFEHAVAFHMYTRANNGRWANCATGDNNAMPDSGIIGLLIDGSHVPNADGNPNDACDISWANSVLGQHRPVAVVVQSDCPDADHLSNITMGVYNGQNFGIGLELDAGAVALVNGSASGAGNVLKADATALYDASGTLESGSPFSASLNISNNALPNMTLYIEDAEAAGSTGGCGNNFLNPTAFLCSAPSFTQRPGGRLTLTQGQPVMTGDVTMATHVYYAAYASQTVPIYSSESGNFGSVPFKEGGLTLDLDSSNQLSGNLYDIFVETVRSGNAELCAGPAWTSSSPGSSVRSFDITSIGGIWVNASALAVCRYGSGSSTSCPIFQCTYLGTMYMTANGQTKQQLGPNSASHGNGNCLCLYNAYNRVSVISASRDSHATYTYTGTWRAMDPTSSSHGALIDNTITVVDGLGEMAIDADLIDLLKGIAGASPSIPQIAIDLDSTSATPGFFSQNQATSGISIDSPFRNPPVEGLWFVQAMESSSGSSAPSFGGSSNQQLSVNLND